MCPANPIPVYLVALITWFRCVPRAVGPPLSYAVEPIQTLACLPADVSFKNEFPWVLNTKCVGAVTKTGLLLLLTGRTKIGVEESWLLVYT
jgi:hypothetical protein